jgi:Glycosyl transferase family 2
MDRTPRFSIVIPTYNRLEFLKQVLSSIRAQTFTDYEVIVVDDGSTDRTREWLFSQGEDVLAITQPNRGPGSARNFGARHASGTYLAFLDSDDLWFPWTLEVYQAVIHKHCDPSFIAGKPYAFSNEYELDRVIPATAQTEQFADYLASSDEWRWWGVSSFVIRNDAFTAAGGFTDEWVNGEDADLALRLGVAAGFVQITAPVTFAYREHAANAMKDAKRTLAGSWSKVYAERLGRYPGGSVRARERRRILTRHTRPVTLGCLQQGLRREAWKLYGATFAWNASLGRVKYLTAFPLLAAMSHSRATESAGTKLGASSEKW